MCHHEGSENNLLIGLPHGRNNKIFPTSMLLAMLRRCLHSLAVLYDLTKNSGFFFKPYKRCNNNQTAPLLHLLKPFWKKLAIEIYSVLKKKRKEMNVSLMLKNLSLRPGKSMNHLNQFYPMMIHLVNFLNRPHLWQIQTSGTRLETKLRS